MSNENMAGTPPIAIIGLAGLFPQAKTLEEYWQNILNGRDCIEPVPPSRWNLSESYDSDPLAPSKTYCRVGGFIPAIDFDPIEFGIPPQQLEQIDCGQLLALPVAKTALLDAGYGPNASYDHARTGVILGVAGTTLQNLGGIYGHSQMPILHKVLRDCDIPASLAEVIMEHYRNQQVDWQEHLFPGALANVISGRISNRLNLGGINCTVDAACASSLSAVNLAILSLAAGHCDLMITGGVDTNNKLESYLCFSKTPVLTHGTQAKSFDADADGTLIAEGIGMLVLKRLSDALCDHDRIYAVIRGIGVSSDGRSKSIFAPDLNGQTQALKTAYQDAAVAPQKVGLIEAHSPGTRAGDDVELAALKNIFQNGELKHQQVAIGSVKSQIGHTKAAAGAASLIKTTLALYHKILPPSLHVKTPNPLLLATDNPFYVNALARPWLSEEKRYAGVSSFGFGGANYHVIVEEHAVATDQDNARFQAPGWPVIITADDKQQLLQQCQTIQASLQISAAEVVWQKLIRTSAQQKLTPTAPRLGFISTSVTDAREKIAQAIDYFNSKPAELSWQHPRGIWYRHEAFAGEVVAVFSGQGAQYTNMGREFSLYHVEYREALQAMDKFFIADDLVPLSTVIFPKTQIYSELLNKTHYTQAAVGAFSLALWEYLQRLGLPIKQCMGHSFGEITALCASGVLSKRDYFSLIYQRGKLFNEFSEHNHCAMLAVQANVITVQALLPAEIYIANINSPTQCVIAGTEADIQKFINILQAEKISHNKIPVTVPYHTPLLQALQERWASIVDAYEFNLPTMKVYSNTLGVAHDAAHIKEILKRHPFETVHFEQNIRASDANGARIFVEVGPRAILSRFIQQTLPDKSHVTIALNESREKDGVMQLHAALLQLRLAGVTLTEKMSLVNLPSLPDYQHDQVIKLTAMNYRSKATNERSDHKPNTNLTAMSSIDKGLSARWLDAEQQLRNIHQTYLQFQMEQQQRIQQQLTHNNLSAPQLAQLQILQEQLERVSVVHANFLARQQPTMGVIAPNLDLTMPALEEKVLVSRIETLTVNPQNNQSTQSVTEAVLAVISDKTGYPPSVLDLTMQLEADLGIDSIKRIEIFAVLQNRYAFTVTQNERTQLKTVSEIIAYIEKIQDVPIPAAPTIEIASTTTAMPTRPLLCYTMAMQPLPKPETLDFIFSLERSIMIVAENNAFSEAVFARLQMQWPTHHIEMVSPNDFATVQSVAICIYIPSALDQEAWLTGMLLAKRVQPDLNTIGVRTTFMIVTQTNEVENYPYQASLPALVQCLQHEWPRVQCRALELASELSLAEKTNAIMQELCAFTPQPNVIIYDASGRNTVQLKLHDQTQRDVDIQASDVFIVTGGGGGITAECIKAMAAKYHCQFIILGRSKAGDIPNWAINAVDEKALKQAAGKFLSAQGLPPKPMDITALVKEVERKRSIAATLAAIAATGSHARYEQVDITDIDAVRDWKNRTDATHIKGIIHGAGVLADKLIENKTLFDMQSVWQPKITGLENLLAQFDLSQLKYLILFSSTAAVFGNAGQADYALANAYFNRRATKLRQQYPELKCLAINWGPWENGMVTEALKQRFMEQGVQIIAVPAGAEIFVRAFSTAQEQTHLVVGNAIPMPLPPLSQLTVTKIIDRKTCRFIQQHTILQTPVLPMAWAMLWINEVLAASYTDYPFINIADLRVLRGIVLDVEAANQYYLQANLIEHTEDHLKVEVILYSESNDHKMRYHYKGHAILSSFQMRAENYALALAAENANYDHYVPLLYSGEYLQYGPLFRGVRKILSLNESEVITHCMLPARDSENMGNFTHAEFHPYAYDIATHAILIWLVHLHQSLCLPSIIGSYQQFQALPSEGMITVIMKIKKFSYADKMVLFSLTGCNDAGEVYFHGDDIQMTVVSIADAMQSIEQRTLAVTAE